jgi:hypothetical protein
MNGTSSLLQARKCPVKVVIKPRTKKRQTLGVITKSVGFVALIGMVAIITTSTNGLFGGHTQFDAPTIESFFCLTNDLLISVPITDVIQTTSPPQAQCECPATHTQLADLNPSESSMLE